MSRKISSDFDEADIELLFSRYKVTDFKSVDAYLDFFEELRERFYAQEDERQLAWEFNDRTLS